MRILNICCTLGIFCCSWKFVRNVQREQFKIIGILLFCDLLFDHDQSCFLGFFFGFERQFYNKFKIQAQDNTLIRLKVVKNAALQDTFFGNLHKKPILFPIPFSGTKFIFSGQLFPIETKEYTTY